MNASLYVHIPFCRKKCDYCDFFSIGEKDRIGKSNDLSDSYIDSLLKEALAYIRLYKITSWNSIYVVGGTPSLLSCEQIFRLVSGLKSMTAETSPSEITVEMNPDDVCPDFLASCEKAGVTRISVGIQALDDKALAAVHRGSNVKIIMNALSTLKKFWKGRLSVDFIAGLPSHTYKSFERQFELLDAFENIDHVSLYTLTLEENTPLYKNIERGYLDFSYEKADKMWLKGRNLLEKHGFLQYEVSNFAKKGFESLHNQAYWRQQNSVGIGAGASGTMYDFEKKTALRWTNTRSLPAYISGVNSGFPEREVENLDCKTLEFEFLMLGFRMLSGVSSGEYEEKFDSSLAERLGADRKDGIFCQWQKKGLAAETKKNGEVFYSLTRRGILLLNPFLESYL
ncbi:MAG: radical SAM family heme chaperone HemW [Treponema sp.]|nr:radical SAM family heme chaperone HemW [Treponema sp.]